MHLKEIVDILEAEVLTGEDYLNIEIETGCASDLMSDVLAFIQPNTILLTGLTTPQVIYTAEMASIRSVCFVRGKSPTEETVELGREKSMILLATGYFLYHACGKLFNHGLGVTNEDDGRKATKTFHGK